MLVEIARLMAMRMSYEDPIRIAQLKLAEFESGAGDPRDRSTDDVAKFRIDELIGALPAVVADPVLDVLEWVGWTHKPVSIRFSTASRWGIRRLKLEASLRRWRLFSVRYAKERAWVERWLHMIGRSLDKAAEGRLRHRANRDHDRRAMATPIARALPTGMRSSTASPSRPSTARCP